MAFYSKKTKKAGTEKGPELSGINGSDLRSLEIGGTEYKTYFTSKFSKRKSFKIPDRHLIYSAIPGKILKVLVKQGQKIQSGDTIVIIEAMKMENRIISSTGGLIKKVHVKEGITIPNKSLIAELEE